MTSHNSIFYGRPQEGFNMGRADTKVDTIQLWKWLGIDDVVQKNALWQETIIRTTLKAPQIMEGKRCRFIGDVFQKCHFRQCRKRAPRRSCVAP